MLKRWCEVTSCNGIIDLYEAKENKNKWGFLFWAAIIVGGMFSTVWFVYRTIEGYISTPTVTNVALVTNNSMEMPDVMLCYMGGLNVSALKQEGFDNRFISGFSMALSDGGMIAEHEELLNSVAPQLENYMIAKNISLMTFVEKFSYNCEDVLEFYSNDSSDKTSCSHAIRFLDGRSGQCFIMKNNAPQMYPDSRGGISFTMKQPTNSYVSVYNPKESEVGYMSDGFAITLEKNLGLQRTGRSISIPLNVKAEIVLNTKRYIRLTKHAECDDRPEIYSSNSCFYNCYVESIYKNCGCFMLNYADQTRLNSTSPICTPFRDIFVCNGNKQRKCQSKCLPKCDEWIFEGVVSYTTMMRKQNNANRSMISIAYHTMQYAQILEVDSFSMDMAIANVGGQFGLWLGASIVTFIQAGYYLCLSFCNRQKRLVQNIVFPVKEGS